MPEINCNATDDEPVPEINGDATADEPVLEINGDTVQALRRRLFDQAAAAKNRHDLLEDDNENNNNNKRRQLAEASRLFCGRDERAIPVQNECAQSGRVFECNLIQVKKLSLSM